MNFAESPHKVCYVKFGKRHGCRRYVFVTCRGSFVGNLITTQTTVAGMHFSDVQYTSVYSSMFQHVQQVDQQCGALPRGEMYVRARQKQRRLNRNATWKTKQFLTSTNRKEPVFLEIFLNSDHSFDSVWATIALETTTHYIDRGAIQLFSSARFSRLGTRCCYEDSDSFMTTFWAVLELY